MYPGVVRKIAGNLGCDLQQTKTYHTSAARHSAQGTNLANIQKSYAMNDSKADIDTQCQSMSLLRYKLK